MRAAIIAAVIVTMGVSESSAADRDKAAARKLLDKGNEAFTKGRFDSALALYESAYAQYPSAKILFNIAEAKKELDDLVGATTAYEAFLEATAGDDAKSVISSRRVASLRIADMDASVGRIRLEGLSSYASVWIDDIKMDVPRSSVIVVAPGARAVVVRSFDGRESRHQLDVPAGQTTTVDASPPAPIAAVQEPEAESSNVTSKGWFWVVVGVGAALAAGTVVAVAATSGSSAPEPELGVFSTSDAGWSRF